jgi:hypothetical protein
VPLWRILVAALERPLEKKRDFRGLMPCSYLVAFGPLNLIFTRPLVAYSKGEIQFFFCKIIICGLAGNYELLLGFGFLS